MRRIPLTIQLLAAALFLIETDIGRILLAFMGYLMVTGFAVTVIVAARFYMAASKAAHAERGGFQ